MSVSKNLKRIRKARGLTLEELAVRTNLTKGYLSRVENDRRSAPVSTLQSLAVALRVDMSELLEGTAASHSHSDGLDIVKADDKAEQGVPSVATGGGYSYKPLVTNLKSKYMSPFLMVVEKGETGVFSHDSEEFGHLVSGEVELDYEGERYQLGTGDSFYLDSRKHHKLINKQEKPAVILAVNFNYRRF